MESEVKTLSDLAVNVARADSARMLVVNPALMKVSIANKRRPAFIQVAVSNEDALGLMLGGKSIGLLLLVDGNEYAQILEELIGKTDVH